MTYPGNSSLSAEIQQRILNTFRQTLELARKGQVEEANLGCDFIIRMDPHFTPVRTLQERLRAGGEVEVEDLRSEVFGADDEIGTPPPQESGGPVAPPSEARSPRDSAPPSSPAPTEEEASFAELNELELDVGGEDSGLLEVGDDAPKPPSAAELRQKFERYLGKRRFQEVLDLAEEHSAIVDGDAALRALLETARTRIEAEPYLKSFLESARQQLEEGDPSEAQRLLEKARKLDPTHPDLLELSGPDRIGEVDHVDIDFGPPRPVEKRAAKEPAAQERPAGTPRGREAAPKAGDDETVGRITALLEEGQAAFERRDYQAAIDSWSRIFLIDMNSQEANRRIDEARRLKAEQDREVEETYHAGLGHLEGGRQDEARAAFEKVLELQPGHLAARDQLERLSGGPTGAETEAPPQLDDLDLDLEEAAEEGDPSFKEEIFVPPDLGAEGREAGAEAGAPAPPPAQPAAPAARPWQAFGIVGGVVLVVALAGGWLLWSNWDRLFPNAVDPSPDPAERVEAPRLDPLERARSLHEEGRTGAAIAQLRRLPPTDPAFEAAQSLIAEWQAPEEEPADGGPAGPTEAELERWEALIAQARDAYSQREYLVAEEHFSRAAEIAPLEGTARDLHHDAMYQAERFGHELELIRQGEWGMALPSLWRLYERDPTDRDVVRLLVDSYHNLGVRELQRQNTDRALEHFTEALSLRPADEELQRFYLFALSYQDRPPDLLYRIYVKYLTLR